MISRRLLYVKKCYSWDMCVCGWGEKYLRSHWFKVYEVMAVPFICRTEISLSLHMRKMMENLRQGRRLVCRLEFLVRDATWIVLLTVHLHSAKFCRL